jgi:hypothetical protein
MPVFNINGSTTIATVEAFLSELKRNPTSEYSSFNLADDTPGDVILALIKSNVPMIYINLEANFKATTAILIADGMGQLMRLTPPAWLTEKDEAAIRSIAQRIGLGQELLLPDTSPQVAALYAKNLGEAGCLAFMPSTPPTVIAAAVASLGLNTDVAIPPKTPKESMCLIASVLPATCMLKLPADITSEAIEDITENLKAGAVIYIPRLLTNEALIAKVAGCIQKTAGGLAVSPSLPLPHLKLAARTITPGVPLILASAITLEKALAVAQSMQNGGTLMLRKGVPEAVTLRVAEALQGQDNVKLVLEEGTPEARKIKVAAILAEKLPSKAAVMREMPKATVPIQNISTLVQSTQNLGTLLTQKGAEQIKETVERAFKLNQSMRTLERQLSQPVALPARAARKQSVILDAKKSQIGTPNLTQSITKNAGFFQSRAFLPIQPQTQKIPTRAATPTNTVPEKRKPSTEDLEAAEILCSFFRTTKRKPSDPSETLETPKSPQP